MANAVDQRLFEELAQKEPKQIVMPPFCQYNEKDKCYLVSAWQGEYAIYPQKAAVEVVSGGPALPEYFYIFLINYLLLEKIGSSTGEWISEKDLPGGVTFFRGPHELPTRLITKTFGDNLEPLRKKCEHLGGFPLEMADCSYGFDIIAGVKIALLYWQGDEDFPAEAKILADSCIKGAMPLDVAYALFCEACLRIGEAEK